MTSYFLPAEWQRQSATILVWPHQQSDWQPRLDTIEPLYCQLAGAICRHQPLVLVCHDEAHRHHVQQQIRSRCKPSFPVHYPVAATNDTWVRDSGPLTVVGPDGAPRLLDFIFNAWGGKFDASLDNQLSAALHRQGLFGTTPLQHIDMVFEGGSIDSDGCGTLLTTTQCLLAETRNPGWTKENIEDRLQQLLGAQRILWLEHGMLMGDDTDSHVDMLARFCSRDTICYTHCDDSHDDHYGPLAKMAEELAEFRQANGNPYRLLPLPWPQAKHAVDGRRLPASYANFLVINDAVIVPTYGDPADEAALQVIGQAFPGREVIGINSLPLIHQSGSIHCATMQLPAGVLPG